MNTNPYAPKPPSGTSINIHAMLATLGMSREQFAALSPQDRQIAGAKYMNAAHQQQQQQQQQQPMMPPPRPPTAQGMSRPGTSLAHRSPTIPGDMRPPSRMASFLFYLCCVSDPHPGPERTIHLSQQNPYPNSSNAPNPSVSPPATMGSPYRGAKRKLTGEMVPINMPGSPRIGGGLGLSGMGMPNQGSNVMGPPSLPRSVSNDSMGGMGGMMPNPGINNMNMGMTMNGMNMNPNMMNGQRQSPRPPSSMAMASAIGMGNMGNMNNMNMNMGMSVDTPTRSHIGQSQGLGPQTPMRQGSLPPQSTPTPQAQMQAQGLMRQGSLPPSGSMPMTPQNMNMGMGVGMGGRGNMTPGGGMNMVGGGGSGMNMNNMGMMNAMGMNMNMNMPSSPHPSNLGPQAHPMAPSISAGSLPTSANPPAIPTGIIPLGMQSTLSASGIAPSTSNTSATNLAAPPTPTSTSTPANPNPNNNPPTPPTAIAASTSTTTTTSTNPGLAPLAPSPHPSTQKQPP
ncbi:hypothetical protein GALMADRAFT_141274 [Galerina marginata CBS 339.88]|uniref:Uncharacterized protein n=1 Tax=Galerina marginata (strain CBS 339.88) TaxID=685588 RepID=A0A067SVN8_GALM3|nr:hypothetical protein GALMADRAFT_141274 [Galerina marginata CBS 339.88]